MTRTIPIDFESYDWDKEDKEQSDELVKKRKRRKDKRKQLTIQITRTCTKCKETERVALQLHSMISRN